MRLALAGALLVMGAGVGAQTVEVPLPEAAVRVVVPDAASLDAMLGGGFRRALEGRLAETDGVRRGFLESRVGAKLADQWARFGGDAGLGWADLQRLKPRELGFALLDVGDLEMLLVVKTQAEPPLPRRDPIEHRGIVYHRVRSGAGDGVVDPSRRMGLAWARTGGWLLLATSARAVELGIAALEEPPLAASSEDAMTLELDLGALSRDGYFRREFMFPVVSADGRMRASLRETDVGWIEVRQGSGGLADPRAYRFDVPAVMSAGWGPGAPGPALRRGILEPEPDPAARPVPSIGPLPSPQGVTDPYLVDFRVHQERGGGRELGDLAVWNELWDREAPSGWGWVALPDGRAAVGFAWPEERERELELAILETLERRAGWTSVERRRGGVVVYRTGPSLVQLATRRTGPVLWIGHDDLVVGLVADVRAEAGLTRWGRVDLAEARGLVAEWNRSEPAGGVRPFSDSVASLLGWMPRVGAVTVERRAGAEGWEERVTFVREPSR